MQAQKILLIFFLLSIRVTMFSPAWSQNKESLVSGPWAGNVEMRSAVIWIEVSPTVKSVVVKYFAEGFPNNIITVPFKGELGKDFNPVKIELNGLSLHTVYHYKVLLDGFQVNPPFPLTFQTKELWQWRKPAPDFTFLAGSCAYFNEPIYDRPGTPYGGDSSIFETMAKEKAAFHVWMGDNWYTREADYFSPWGLRYRASHDRSKKVLQAFMASMPQYSIWDDHDFGPDDEGRSFILKEESRKVFMNYSCNPSYGEDGKGIYTKVSYSDVELFLTDDRYFRSEDNLQDSINGEPNKAKKFFGDVQMDWLKNSLSYSKATFKIIVVGSQVLNPYNVECMRLYTAAYNELMDFLAAQKIQGVLLFTGDRHHGEVLKLARKGTYPLYDITMSPYTAGITKAKGNELNHPLRVPGTLVEQQHYGRISVNGPKGNRMLKVEFIGLKGNKLAEWSIHENELQTNIQ